jgi:serine/threonine protein kinase
MSFAQAFTDRASPWGDERLQWATSSGAPIAFAAGHRLGPYEILSALGAGGMGEVYKARDTRLDRTVAIKIVSHDLASEPHFRERFDREARTISQLDHPHICALYDVGEQDGKSFLVMQYLDGETLEVRLQRGALPIDQALSLAIQISEALDTAHRAGIVHRDLKPGNVMLTKSGPKLLDFGLAKPSAESIAATAGSFPPTAPATLTAQGMILGTLQYMAPEQLEGRDADARTDLFAFGCVVYEMLTGQKAFAGHTQASLIAAILEHEPPPIGTSQPLTPPTLDHIVRRCLAKNPEERWQTAGDVMRELKWIAESGSPASGLAQTAVQRGIRGGLWWVLTAVSLLVATVLAVVVVNLRSQRQEPFRFSITPPGNPDTEMRWNIAISPDGRRLAFVAPASGGVAGSRSTPMLWVQPLDNVVAEPLPGTEGASYPFWSPDSRFLGFFADAKLKKIDVSAGSLQVLCDARPGYGGTWNAEGVILFAPRIGEGLYRVSDAGGDPAKVTTLDASRHEAIHAYPAFLPDGRHFLFGAGTLAVDGRGLRLGSLDSHDTTPVLNVNSNALYAPPGYLLFVREGNLMAQAFDATSGTLSGKAVAVAQHVGWSPSHGLGFFSVSRGGVLVYRREMSPGTQLQWVDRTGKKLGTVGEPAAYSNPALSYDGTKLAVGRVDLHTGTSDIWVFDLQRDTPSRFTDTSGAHINPVWSGDGQHILFTSDRKGHRDIYQKATSGVGAEDVVIESESAKSIDDMTFDGRYLVYDTGGGGGQPGLWVLPLFGNAKPFRLPQPTKSSFGHGQFSPNGRWIAYTSDESGKDEVYAETFPERRDKWPISKGGGSEPMWRRDGKELFYLAGDNIMAVDVKTSGDQFQPGIPRAVIVGAGVFGDTQRNRYVVTADGQRFLIVSSAEQGPPSPITVVMNWVADLKK